MSKWSAKIVTRDNYREISISVDASNPKEAAARICRKYLQQSHDTAPHKTLVQVHIAKEDGSKSQEAESYFKQALSAMWNKDFKEIWGKGKAIKESTRQTGKQQMKKYTRKQISEAIKHWKGVLKKMNESRSNVGEQKYKIGFDVVTEMYTKDGRFLGIMEKPQFDKMMKEIEKKYGVKTEVVSYNGPGGGWPYVEIIGDKESLKAVYEIWYCNGNVDSCDSFEDVFKEAIPVGINEAAVVDEYPADIQKAFIDWDVQPTKEHGGYTIFRPDIDGSLNDMCELVNEFNAESRGGGDVKIAFWNALSSRHPGAELKIFGRTVEALAEFLKYMEQKYA